LIKVSFERKLFRRFDNTMTYRFPLRRAISSAATW
jgi:hypothetical protein